MKIAVVGTGSVGRRHLANLLELGLTELIAVSEHGRKTGLEVAGVQIPVLHDYEDALKASVDAVIICNPTSMHLDYLRRAIESGKHVYLEKPASISADGLNHLIAEADGKKLIAAMGTIYRFNECLEELREKLLAGEHGAVLSVETVIGEHIADYHPGEDYRQSYTARAELGGGVLLTQIHQIDWLNWLFGPFDKVFAIGGHRSSLDIDVEDTVSYLLLSANGTPAYGHLDYLQRPKRAGITVTGTAARLEWDLFDCTLNVTPSQANAPTTTLRSAQDRNSMFVAAMKDFLDAIKKSTRPRATLADGQQALCIVDAIKASLASRNTENISL